MYIQNFEQLAISSLRRQALYIAEAGLAAIQTAPVVRDAVQYDAKKDVLIVQGVLHSLREKDRVVAVGFGKAAYEAVSALYELLGTRISCGFVLDLKGRSQGNLDCTVGTHPYPTSVNVAATQKIVEVVSGLTDKDLLLCVVSGGGSSLLCNPYEMSCETQVRIVQTLMRSGATIEELNMVRKHISLVKGGQLAAAAYPAEIINLVFSDIPGNNMDTVASGPTMFDATTIAEAATVLKKYNVLELCQMPSCSLRETPKDAKLFERTSSYLLVSGSTALLAMQGKAEDLGFRARLYNSAYSGEARALAAEFALAPQPGECVLAAGESTVISRHEGKGGRNLEMALAALPRLSQGQVFVALDSDGYDNTPYAGALVDTTTLERARRLGVSPDMELQSNNSFLFFEQVGDHIDTGLTGANVADLVISIRE